MILFLFPIYFLIIHYSYEFMVVIQLEITHLFNLIVIISITNTLMNHKMFLTYFTKHYFRKH
jgi:hypothetical protein